MDSPPNPQVISHKPSATSHQPKIFITGTTGAIASYFLDYLSNSDFEVYALLSKPEKIVNDLEGVKNIHFVLGVLENIADFKDIISDCDYIIHLATNWADPNVPEHSINNVQTNLLFSLADPNKIKRIIYFSTASILGRGNKLIPEAREYGTNYIVSKYDGYLSIQNHPLKEKIITVFPTMVIAGDSKHRYSHIGEGLLNAKKYIKWARFCSINGTFHFIHADDIAKMSLFLLTLKDYKSEYVFGNPPQKLGKALKEVAKYYGYKTLFQIPIPIFLIRLIVFVFRLKMDNYGKFCLRYKHFVYDSVNASSFGLSTNVDTWEKIMVAIEEAQNNQ
jgi:nucleoside-diphosphate-sugar epimerase